MRKYQQIGSEHVDEGIDLADLFENPDAGPIHPFPAKILLDRKPKIIQPRVMNPQIRCKCGNTGSRSCLTKSCRLCCSSRYCKKHGKKNRRIELGQNNQRFERRQNPVLREKNSLFGSILSSLPNFFGGLVFLSVLGLFLGSAYIAFNAFLPVFEEIRAFLEFLWEVGVSIVDFLVAVANFIGSVIEFIFSILKFIYEILEFIILFFVAIIALVVWLIVGILSYASELLAWIF